MRRFPRPSRFRRTTPARIEEFVPAAGRALRTPRLTLRAQLTLLYAAFFLAAGVAVLSLPFFTIRSSLSAGASPAAVAQERADVHAQVVRTAGTLVILVVASVAVGWLIAGRFLRPLRTMTAIARDISASNLNRRLNPGALDNEFTELGETLNDLFGRLEASFESQRRFVANASHELRTPLSAGRTVLQVALADPDATVETLRAACREVLDLGDQQERLIGALLTLAGGQRGLARSEPMDLGELTRKVLLARRHEAARRGVEVHTALAPAPATGDPHLAESLVANLVDNAIRHNLPGGRVEVSTTPTDAGAVISVSNTGPVIPPDEVARLFEPFRQHGAERIRHGEGHGLGLTIVKAIADAHGATLTTHARARGGLDVTARFTPRPWRRCSFAVDT